ncbi:MAG: amidohydrolase family protein [Candidatus Neomarinimicrobiota bacterium]
MIRRMLTLALLPALIPLIHVSASDQTPAPPQDHPIVLTGGEIHIVSGPTISNGQLLFTDGRLVEIGRRVTVPPGAEVIDVSGMEVYPGFIAAETTIGLGEIQAVRASLDSRETGLINPNVRAERAYHTDSEHIPVSRSNGVAIAHVAPVGGLLSGSSAVMMLDGWTWEDALLKDQAGIWVNWPEMAPPRSNDPDTVKKHKQQLEETLKHLDEAFDQAAIYQRAKSAGTANLQTDLRWEALEPVLAGRVPLFIRATRLGQITAAINWTRRRGLRLVLVEPTDAWMVTDLLREHDIPVILPHIHDLPLRRWSPYDEAFTLPATLHAAGVTFCFTGQNLQPRNISYEAGKAVAFGLPRDEAIKALTLNAARVLGVDQRIGSLEVGKDATLIVTNGDPLDIRSHVEMMFIQGRRVDLTSKHTQLYEKYRERHRQLGIEGGGKR